MAILSNARHERFAQLLAAGKSADEAYHEAGFKPSRANASTLKAKQNIQARVAELQSRVTEGVIITKQWVLERLVDNLKRSMQAEAVHRDGEVVGEYSYQGSVANRALELLGKELGMFVDRKDVRLLRLTEMTTEQLDDFLSELGADEKGISPGRYSN